MPAPSYPASPIARLQSYYSFDKISAENPGGFDSDGHRVNLIPAFKDIAATGLYVGAVGEYVEGLHASVSANLALTVTAKDAAAASAAAAATFEPSNYVTTTSFNLALSGKASTTSVAAVAATVPVNATAMQAVTGTEDGLVFMTPYDVKLSIDKFGAASAPTALISASYTVDAADRGKTLRVNGAAIGFTAAAAATLGAGFFFRIRNRFTNGIATFDPDGSETIDGLPSIRIYQEDVTIFTDGANWFTLGRQRGWLYAGATTAPASTSGAASGTISTLAAIWTDPEVSEIECYLQFKYTAGSGGNPSTDLTMRLDKGSGFISSNYRYQVNRDAVVGSAASVPILNVSGGGTGACKNNVRGYESTEYVSHDIISRSGIAGLVNDYIGISQTLNAAIVGAQFQVYTGGSTGAGFSEVAVLRHRVFRR